MAAIHPDAGARSPKREAIERSVLLATETLLEEGSSWSELSIERITSRAGISRTAFYFYFRDKRDLLMRLAEEAAALLYSEAEGWWSSAGDGRADLPKALDRVIGLYLEHGTVLRTVSEAATYDEPVATFWRALVGRFIQATSERIEREQAAGRANPGPTQAIAFTLVWCTERACYQQLAQGGPLETDALREALAVVWLGAIYGCGAGDGPA